MTGWSEPFRWTVVVQRALVGETEAAVRALAVRVVACCPAAASVIVSSCAGVGLLDAEGEVLDVADLDADLAVEVAELFGVGVYGIAVAMSRKVRVSLGCSWGHGPGGGRHSAAHPLPLSLHTRGRGCDRLGHNQRGTRARYASYVSPWTPCK